MGEIKKVLLISLYTPHTKVIKTIQTRNEKLLGAQIQAAAITAAIYHHFSM